MVARSGIAAVVVAVAAFMLAPAAAAQDTAPQDTAPQDTAPQDTAPQDTAPQDTASQDTASPEVQNTSTAGFADVTGGVHKPAIDALAELGVFKGTACGQEMFCPGEEMKRWTMAVWLVRVLDEAEPPAATEESSFADVDFENWWLAHVERLAELEVTKGCLVDPLRFCPDQSVTRAQMATLLTRALDLAEADPAGFADTADHAHAADIDALAAARITAGCATDPLRYCPDRPVTRSQMATFLARALGLVEVPEPTEDTPATPAGDTDTDPNTNPDTDTDTPPTPATPEASACRPRGTPHTTAGFPLPEWAAPSIGTLRVAVLFLDFPDAQARHSTRDEAALGLPYAEAYLEAASYAKLDVEFIPVHGWLRAGRNSIAYLSEFAGEMRVSASAEAIRLADPSFDFTGIHAVMTVQPSSHFRVGDHTFGMVHTEEGPIRLMAGVNTEALSERRDPTEWGLVAAHELAHSLGLADLYPYDAERHALPELPSTTIWVRSEFGLMRLKAAFKTHPEDGRIEISGRYRYGRRVTGYTLYLEALEMLAWSRWQLGWLDESQVRCVTTDGARVTLGPVAGPGDATAMAVVPLSDTEMLVIESRRKVGYDGVRERRHHDGAILNVPALGSEGVLVYIVDASVGSGEVPMVLAGDPGNGQVDDYPILTRRERELVVRGYTITVVSDRGGTHVVAINRVRN